MKTMLSSLFLLFYFTIQLIGQWSIEFLSESRTAIAATASQDKAYFAGGFTMNAYSNVVDIYDKEESNWSVAQLSTGRAWIAAVNGNEKLFFAGGEDINASSGDWTSDVVDIYDEVTEEWTTKSLSEGRVFLAAVKVGDKVLFAGGIKRLNWQNSIFETTNRVDIFDLTTGEWTTDTLSQARAFMASTVCNNMAFFAGGWVGPGEVSNVVDIYDFDTDTWDKSTLSIPRAQAAGATVGNKVLFAGGGLSASFTPTDVVDIYDLDSKEWSSASISFARGELLAASIKDKVFFVGGGTIDQETLRNGPDPNTYFKAIDVYDNTTFQWTIDSLQFGRVNHAVTALENKLFVAGGNHLNNIVDEIEVLDLSTVSVLDPTKLNMNLIVYPNPTSDILITSIRGIENTATLEGEVLLHESTGQLIIKSTFTGNSFELSLKDLPKGIYFITVVIEDSQSVRKIVLF